MKKFVRAFGVITAAVFTISADGMWFTNVVAADRSYEIGNQEAETTLTEFVSYTCPHCATFAIEGDAPLQMVYVGSGKLKLEVRSVIRNDVDLAATLMVQCGDTDKFMQNHTMFMTKHDTWMPKVRSASQTQINVWTGPDQANGFRAMATYLGFYDMMETRGYSRPQLDRCLADTTQAAKLEANTTADFEDFGITGTPSFAINGKVLPSVHSWKALHPKLDENF